MTVAMFKILGCGLRAAVLVIAIADLPRGAPTAQAADWPQWRGPTRDGISIERDWTTKWPAKGPKLLWQTPVGGGYSSVAVVGSRVYTMGFVLDEPGPDKKYKTDEDGRRLGKDIVWCLDAETGKVLWKHSYPAPGDDTFSTPAVCDGRVYTLGRFGQLFCLDAADGRVVWHKNLMGEFGGKRPYDGYACSPLVLQDRVVVEAGGQARLLALDAKTGQLAWKRGTGDAAGMSSPVPYRADGKPAVLMLTPKMALGVNVGGEELWHYSWKGGGYTLATPLVHGDRVLLSVFPRDGLSLMLQLTSAGPKEIWKSRGMGLLFHSGVLVDGHVYGPYSFEGEAKSTLLQCVSWDTGKVEWTHVGLGFTPLILADGKLILTTDDGNLVVAEASPKAYKELARAKVMDGGYGQCWICPVLCDGRLYTRRHWGNLLCLDLKGPLANSP